MSEAENIQRLRAIQEVDDILTKIQVKNEVKYIEKKTNVN